MNILVVTSEIGLLDGGSSLSCSRIVNMLSKKHRVIVLKSSEYPIITLPGGYSVTIWDGVRKEFKLKTDSEVYKDTDIVVAFGGKYNGYYSTMLSKYLHKQLILCLRGTDVNLSKWSIEDTWYLHEACDKAYRIVCLSQEMKKNILNVCPTAINKVVIIPNEMKGLQKKVVFHNLPSKLVIGCAATHLNEKKGIANLLRMLYELKKISKIPIKMEIVGSIDEDLKKQYEEEAIKTTTKENLVLWGETSREKFHNIMKSWDLYIQGSVCEGHPNAVSESLQNGVGFISSKTGFIAETLMNKFPMLFFESWEPQSMAKSIMNLINIKDKEKIYYEACKLLYETCNKQIIYEKWEKLLGKSKKVSEELNINHIISVGLHDVQGEIHDSITTPVEVFRQFVSFVHDRGFGLCSMRDYMKMSQNDMKCWIVCTFDDGYSNIESVVMPILRKYGYTATVFICTSHIGKNNTWNNKDAILRQHLSINQINSLVKEGWEIASHGVTHQNLLKLSSLEVERELSDSQQILKNLVGYSSTFAYPYGAYNKYIQNQVMRYYDYAFCVEYGGTSLGIDNLQIKRYSISEIYNMLKGK